MKKNNIAKLLPIINCVLKNAKSISINNTLFRLKCGFYSSIFFEKNTDPYFYLKIINTISINLQNMLIFCNKNFYYALKL